MSFEELQSVDTRAVKPEDVVDIQQIKIDDGLSQQEKRREFNPAGKKILLFPCGEGHCQGKLQRNGVSLNERFEELVMSV